MGKKTYLTFEERPTDRVTKVFRVWSSGDGEGKKGVLGTIEWYNHWRRYVFFIASHSFFDSACLVEIATFIDTLMKDRKSPESVTVS